MLDISRGCRGAHADGLVMAIDPVEIAVEPAGTFAEPMKLIDNVGNEICDDLPERVRCRQRLDKAAPRAGRSEEHTSELQSLMRNSYAVFCLKTKTITHL